MKIYWLFLICAVVSNIIANVAFKLTMISLQGENGPGLVVAALSRAWFWVAISASVILLVTYLLALRQLGLAVSYAVVTSSAIVGISIASSVIFGEGVTPVRALGIAAIIGGLFLIVRDELMRTTT
jgi:multidrug transporter EmrE-like cation transporter